MPGLQVCTTHVMMDLTVIHEPVWLEAVLKFHLFFFLFLFFLSLFPQRNTVDTRRRHLQENIPYHYRDRNISQEAEGTIDTDSQISTLADVQENVMEYLHVLSRPKVIDQEHDVVWTEAYIDSTVSLWGPWARGWVCPPASGQGFHQLWGLSDTAPGCRYNCCCSSRQTKVI